MADRKISDLTALTTPASGDYLPIVDISEASAASKNKRITIEELMRGVPDGTAAAPGIAFETDPNTGIYSPGADQLAVSTGGTARLYVGSTGLVGIGTTSPSYPLHVRLDQTASTNVSVQNTSAGSGAYAQFRVDGDSGSGYFGYAGSGSGGTGLYEADYVYLASESNASGLNLGATSGPLRFFSQNSERGRFDASGRLLVGTSSALTGGDAQYSLLQVVGSQLANDYAIVVIGREQAATAITSGQSIGQISFTDNGGNEFGTIKCTADANAGSGDYPGRLVFSTTADGGSSPTERMRIGADGRPLFYSSGGGIACGVADGAGTSTELFAGIYSRTGTTTGGTASIIIYSNGNVLNTNNSYGSLSDLKLKENIVDATSQWSDIKAFRIRKYNFKEGQTHTQIGVVANEIELISPGLVTESPDRDEEGNDLGTVTKSVNYSVLYMKAVKALQEAMERIETLEARLTAAGIE